MAQKNIIWAEMAGLNATAHNSEQWTVKQTPVSTENWVGKSGRLYQPFWKRTSRGESEKMSAGSSSSVSHMSLTIHKQKYKIVVILEPD